MLTSYHHPVPLTWNLGALTFWKPLGPSGTEMGLNYLWKKSIGSGVQVTEKNYLYKMWNKQSNGRGVIFFNSHSYHFYLHTVGEECYLCAWSLPIKQTHMQSVRLFWTRNRLVTEASKWKHTTVPSDRHSYRPAEFEPATPAKDRLQICSSSVTKS